MHSLAITCMDMATISFDPIAIFAENSKECPHYHPLQSSSPSRVMLSKLMVRSSSEPTLPKPSSATMQPTMPDEAPTAGSSEPHSFLTHTFTFILGNSSNINFKVNLFKPLK